MFQKYTDTLSNAIVFPDPVRSNLKWPTIFPATFTLYESTYKKILSYFKSIYLTPL